MWSNTQGKLAPQGAKRLEGTKIVAFGFILTKQLGQTPFVERFYMGVSISFDCAQESGKRLLRKPCFQHQRMFNP